MEIVGSPVAMEARVLAFAAVAETVIVWPMFQVGSDGARAACGGAAGFGAWTDAVGTVRGAAVVAGFTLGPCARFTVRRLT